MEIPFRCTASTQQRREQLLLLNFKLSKKCRKNFLCDKIFVKKCEIWGWEPLVKFGGKIKNVSTHNIFCQKIASIRHGTRNPLHHSALLALTLKQLGRHSKLYEVNCWQVISCGVKTTSVLVYNTKIFFALQWCCTCAQRALNCVF